MPAPARQLCAGSSRQLMTDAAATVECPSCLKSFSSFETTKNRAQRCPIVPSHLPDLAGRAKVETATMKRKTSSATPRPY